MDKFMLILAYDGDNAGRLVGRAILADDANALADASNRINHGHDIVRQWVSDHGGQMISGGGDEGVFQIPQEALADIEQLRKDYQYATQLTITVGVGNTLSEAGKALMVGKFRGKDQVVQYDDSVEADMKAAQEHVAGGQGSEEENKIDEAYLEKDGPMAEAPDLNTPLALSEDEQTDDHLKDCPYCQEMDSKGEHDMSTCDCPYCQEYDAKQQAAEGQSGDESLDNCPYCQEMHSEDDHVHDENCEHCKEYDAQQAAAGDQAQPDEQAEAPQAEEALTPDLIPQGEENEVPQSQGEEGSEEEIESSQEVLQQLDQERQEGSQEGQAQVSPESYSPTIDDTELAAVNEGMEENVSRPEGYNQNSPGDMGLSEDGAPDSPDMGEVLQGGLDEHADEIQKEKIVQMVSDTLKRFKAQKQILERAQEQAPEFYQSVIMMLRAMIEMAKFAGLGQSGSEDSDGPIEPQGDELVDELDGQGAPGEEPQGDENEWHDPFPTHPDNAAAQGDAAQDPKPKRQ